MFKQITFKSKRICSEQFLFTKVVATPVFPPRPVLPILWTIKKEKKKKKN